VGRFKKDPGLFIFDPGRFKKDHGLFIFGPGLFKKTAEISRFLGGRFTFFASIPIRFLRAVMVQLGVTINPIITSVPRGTQVGCGSRRGAGVGSAWLVKRPGAAKVPKMSAANLAQFATNHQIPPVFNED